MSKLFTIGADPEVFLTNRRTFVSSIGLLGGSKEKPKQLGNGFAILEDNVAAEFNIPPANTAKKFVANVQKGLQLVKDIAKQRKLFVNISASAIFTDEALSHPMAKVFGCDPDYNAWSLSINPYPVCNDPNLRAAGGHVHIGTDLVKEDVIRAMDLFLGCPSVEKDPDQRRRQLYGKAGAFRPKHYGVEYRTLSNFWISSTENIEWVYNQTEKAISFVQSNPKDYLKDFQGGVVADAIQRCINTSDVGLFKQLQADFHI